MKKYTYLYIIVCILIIYLNQQKLQVYYIQYNPKTYVYQGSLVNKKNKMQIYDSNNGNIINIFNIPNLLNNTDFLFYYENVKKYPKIIHPVDIQYSNNLLLNGSKLEGNNLILIYNTAPTVTYIENNISSKNIITIIDQIIDYTEKTKNKILFIEYFIDHTNDKLLVKSFLHNKNGHSCKIANILVLIISFFQKRRINIYKQLIYYIIGEISNLINSVEDHVNNNNPILDLSNNFFYKLVDNKDDKLNEITDHTKFKTYKINGYNITKLKIEDIKKIMQNKKDIPKMNANLIKNNKIGDGLFSDVYKNGDKIIKIIKQNYIESPELIEEVNSSIAINKINDSNKYFPKFYRVFLSKHKEEILLCLEYEYIPGQLLSKFLKDQNIKYKGLDKIIKNIISANNFLNKSGIVRSDNHSNNIIIQDNYDIKYIDLGRTYLDKPNIDVQYDDYNYFKILTKLAIIISLINVDNKKQLLNIILKEYLEKLGKTSSK